MIEWIKAGSALMGAVGGLKGAPAQPGIATSAAGPIQSRADVDFSGFTVATGRARADGAKIQKTTSDLTGAGAGTTEKPISMNTGAILGLMAAAGVIWLALRE